MSNEMIERVAKEIAKIENPMLDVNDKVCLGEPYRWKCGFVPGFSASDELWKHYVPAAKAAIEAMREPTDNQANEFFKMKRAEGYPEGDAVFSWANWERAIDAALK